jgi:hypothetical protein
MNKQKLRFPKTQQAYIFVCAQKEKYFLIFLGNKK